ncbi:glycosyltransferase family 2 protein [Desulfurobacterium sp.]
MRQRKVAILMATYNGARFLSQQLDSLLSQTYDNWFLLVHDDGSEDETVDILKSYRDRYSDQIFLIEDNLTFGNAKDNFSYLMKTALEMENSFEYFFFCDQDDVWVDNKIELFLERFAELEKRYVSCPILLHSDLMIVDSSLDVISKSMWQYQKLNPECKTLNYLLVQNNITGCACAVNRMLLELAYPIPVRAIMHDWWLALVASAFGRVDFMNEPTVLYRQHGLNDTGAKRIDIGYAIQKVTRRRELINSIIKTMLQARDFLQVYDHKLDQKNKEMVKSYMYLPYLSYAKKLFAVFKYRFFKQNFLRNLGFLWYLRYVKEDIYDICDYSHL